MKKIYITLDEENFVVGYSEKNVFLNSKTYIFESEEDFYSFQANSFLYKLDKASYKLVYVDKSSEIEASNNKKKIEFKIAEIKSKLDNTDYQIIKCYEAFMRQQPLPYNLEELSAQRDSWRAEINQLEEELKAL